jgi:hypothetical protein
MGTPLQIKTKKNTTLTYGTRSEIPFAFAAAYERGGDALCANIRFGERFLVHGAVPSEGSGLKLRKKFCSILLQKPGLSRILV